MMNRESPIRMLLWLAAGSFVACAAPVEQSDGVDSASSDATLASEPGTPPALAATPPAVLAATPPMGFNTWNRFQCDVSETLVHEMTDAMVATGMRDVGYEYVVIDDCWQVGRTDDGTIVADPERFPSGIKALADYVHEQGLKFGLYTDVGDMTCQDRPGSLGYEEQDAQTYASWGVDYVKVDWCHSEGMDPADRYRTFREAFDATGRPMVHSICEWGRNAPADWAREWGHLWRTTADIQDSWSSLQWTLSANRRHADFAGPGHWNDPDMLQIGNGGMTISEYRAKLFALGNHGCAADGGNDLRTMTDDIRAILTNEEVIAVDQDVLGVQGTLVLDRGYGLQVWSKPLADGSVAAVIFNQSDEELDGYVRWRDVGLPPGPARVRDLWAHEDLGTHSDTGVYEERFQKTVPPHDVVMLRLTPDA